MSNRLIILGLLLVTLILVVRENFVHRPKQLYVTTSGRVESLGPSGDVGQVAPGAAHRPHET